MGQVQCGAQRLGGAGRDQCAAESKRQRQPGDRADPVGRRGTHHGRQQRDRDRDPDAGERRQPLPEQDPAVDRDPDRHERDQDAGDPRRDRLLAP